jgi:hypothetical protein
MWRIIVCDGRVCVAQREEHPLPGCFTFSWLAGFAVVENEQEREARTPQKPFESRFQFNSQDHFYERLRELARIAYPRALHLFPPARLRGWLQIARLPIDRRFRSRC